MVKIILIPVQRILNNDGKLNDAANHWALIMVKDFIISYIDPFTSMMTRRIQQKSKSSQPVHIIQKFVGNLTFMVNTKVVPYIIVVVTGGAGKSIQSKNVAAVVAGAAAVAGLPSPAATHHMKKMSGWRKKALFLSLFLFF